MRSNAWSNVERMVAILISGIHSVPRKCTCSLHPGDRQRIQLSPRKQQTLCLSLVRSPNFNRIQCKLCGLARPRGASGCVGRFASAKTDKVAPELNLHPPQSVLVFHPPCRTPNCPGLTVEVSRELWNWGVNAPQLWPMTPNYLVVYKEGILSKTI
jgi:hypothetical protein